MIALLLHTAFAQSELDDVSKETEAIEARVEGAQGRLSAIGERLALGDSAVQVRFEHVARLEGYEVADIEYFVDDRPMVYEPVSGTNATEPNPFAAGSHTLRVLLSLRGTGAESTYMSSYAFKTQSTHVLALPPDQSSIVSVILHPSDNARDPRPRVELEVRQDNYSVE